MARAISYYEEHTGAYGDARNLQIFEAPQDEAAYEDDMVMWEVMNASDSVSLAEIAEVLWAARTRLVEDEYASHNDLIERIDSVLEIIDPEE